MPNPRAQKQVTLDRVTEDLKSFSQPLTAIADMMAGALRGSAAATAGLGGDVREIVDIVAPETAERVLGKRTLPTTEEMSGMLPPAIPKGALPVRQKSADFGQSFGEFTALPGSATAAKALGYGAGRLAGSSVKNAGKAINDAMIYQTGPLSSGPLSVLAPKASVMNVIKPKGGNWLTGDVEKAVGSLKSQNYQIAPELLETFREGARDVADPQNARMIQRLREHEAENALNNWVDRNLTNYVKKEMATPEDPVRKLAEQGITHLPSDTQLPTNMSAVRVTREEAGFPEALGKSEQAQLWEALSDKPVGFGTAGEMTSIGKGEPWMEKVDPFTRVYGIAPMQADIMANDLGFDHIIDVLKQDLAEGRIRPEQLNKVSMEQAVRRTYEYDQEMAKKMAEAQIKATEGMPIHKEYPEGYRWIELALPEAKLGEGYRLVKDEPSVSNWKVVPHPDGDGYALRADNGQYALGSSSYAERKWKTPDEAKAEIPNYAEIQEVDPDEAYKVFDPSGNVIAKSKTEKGALNQLDAEERTKVLENALKYEGDTMGHCVGGYCPDVLEGRSRIFSLRDAKGEPHVTIEVEPQSRIGFREGEGPKTAEERFDLKTEWLKGVESGKIGDDVSFAQWWRSQHGIPEPERPLQISQIKGKQNRAPKEEYLPYVQDFVRGGQWSDVGDIANAGLRDMKGYEPLRKYLEGKGVKYERYIPESEFKQFEDDFLMDRLYPKDDPAYLPPTEGMKRGGKVSVSDNCDCQMMEVEDKKFGKGGLAKEGAEAVVKALTKQAAKEAVAKESAIKASEALGKIEGQHLGITQADRTKVGGKWLGGPGFSGLQLERPEYKAAEAVWGVRTPETAKTILGSQTKEGKPVVFTTMLGSPTQHQSNQMVFNELLRLFNKSAKEGNLDPDQYAKINERLRMAVDKDGKPVFPEDVDILSPNFKKIANTFDRRAIAGNIMGGVGVGGKKGQIFPYDKVIQHTTDPALVDVPAGSLGNRMFTLSGGVVQRPDLHPAFPTILQGEDLGVTFTPVMRDLVMKDFIEKTMKEKGRTPGYMDYTRGYPPTQLITEELLTNLQKQGYKKGGKVAKPMQKAEGGEIRAEDLSIEERPL